MMTSSIELPRTRAVPAVGKIRPISNFSVVVLPAPFGAEKSKDLAFLDAQRQIVERAAHSLAPEAHA